MRGKKLKQSISLTPEELMVYSAAMSGIPVKDLAEQTKKSKVTIYAWINKIKAYIAEDYNIEDFRQPLHGLYTLWMNSVVANLKNCDSTFTIAHGKGMGYYQEKQHIEHSDSTIQSSEELFTQLEKAGVLIVPREEEDRDDISRTKVPS